MIVAVSVTVTVTVAVTLTVVGFDGAEADAVGQLVLAAVAVYLNLKLF